jgi:hypothetical protein
VHPCMGRQVVRACKGRVAAGMRADERALWDRLASASSARLSLHTHLSGMAALVLAQTGRAVERGATAVLGAEVCLGSRPLGRRRAGGRGSVDSQALGRRGRRTGRQHCRRHAGPDREASERGVCGREGGKWAVGGKKEAGGWPWPASELASPPTTCSHGLKAVPNLSVGGVALLSDRHATAGSLPRARILMWPVLASPHSAHRELVGWPLRCNLVAESSARGHKR